MDYTEFVKDWPTQSQQACQRLVDKYGPPQEATKSLFIWHDNGPWKRTQLSRDPVHHNWPMEHDDMVESVIDYAVPPEKAGELARFDGSVIVERTKGELSARCEAEEANFLALNIAHDLLAGKVSVEQAREEYARNMQQKQKEGMGPYMTAFRFDLPRQETADPDQATLDENGNRLREEQEVLPGTNR